VTTELDKKLFELEKRALVGDLIAANRLVSYARTVRAASKELLRRRHQDGEVDAVALILFQEALIEAARVAVYP
jgi:hypothetical protein